MKVKSICSPVLLLVVIVLFNSSCKKTVEQLPAIATTPFVNIALTTAICGGTVTNTGGLTVTEKGVCWDTVSGPTVTSWKALSDSSTTALNFYIQLTGLIPNKTYYVRAFAYNAIGISYGNEIVLTTNNSLPVVKFGTMSDVDGNSYKSVTIGTQTWMAENLRVTKFTDGSAILNFTDSTSWSNDSTALYAKHNAPAFCTFDDTTDASAILRYGRLYNWYAVNTKILCPQGWHVPSDSEWTILSNYLIQTGFGYHNTGNTIAKALSDTGWTNCSDSATVGNAQNTNNKSGFAARPAGGRVSGAVFHGLGTDAYWWASSGSDTSASYYHINYSFSSLGHLKDSPKMGLSVRCVKN